MSLIGSTNEEKIWNYLKAKGLPDCGIAGLMGNLYAESCLIPTNLQNSYEKALSFTDAAYTERAARLHGRHLDTENGEDRAGCIR